jgi:hypothetical protein
LVRLGELLQACVTFPEAFAVVGSAMSEFLGGLSGSVDLTSASRNLVEEVAHWGATRSSLAQFAPEDCWALPRRRSARRRHDDREFRSTRPSRTDAIGP